MTASPQIRYRMAFRLGQNDAFLRCFVPIDTQAAPPLAVPLALRLLRRLWLQYREDRALEGPASLLSNENLQERAHFLASVIASIDTEEEFWVLGQAIDQLQRLLSPEDRITDFTDILTEQDQELLNTVQMAILAASRDNKHSPDVRLHRLLNAFKYSNDLSERPVAQLSPCWAVNLVAALTPMSLGISTIPLPFPGLFRREMFRADRSDTWCEMALVNMITVAAETVMAETIDLQSATSQFDDIFPHRRSNGRINDVYHLLSGFGQLTATQIARGTGMTEPGARKLLHQLSSAGFAYKVDNGAQWSSIVKFRIGPPQHHWLDNMEHQWLKDKDQPDPSNF